MQFWGKRGAGDAGAAGAGGAGNETRLTRLPSWAFPLVTTASLLIGATSIVRGTRALNTIEDSDLTNFFFKSADYILRGDIWHMYAVRGSGLTSTYPNFNPPLSIVLMAPLLGLARALGFTSYGQEITFVSMPFILLVPLLGYLTVLALRRLYPDIPETQQFLAYLIITLSPLTWQTYGTWYHVEQPLMLCFLVGSILLLQAHHEWLAGLLAGLAFLSRTTSLIPLIALGVLLLATSEWRALIKFGGVAAVIAAIGLGPFFLFDSADARYSFLTWRGGAPIGGNSVWTIFASSTTSGIRHTLDSVARRLDMYTVILVVVILAFLAARRLHITAFGREAWAVVTLAALTVPMLSKTNWPYYYLEPFVFLVIWEFASMYDRRPGVWRWPVLTFAYLAVTASLSQYIGLQSVGALDRVAVGILEFAVMLTFVAAIWLRIQASKVAAGAREMYQAPQPMAAVAPQPQMAGPAQPAARGERRPAYNPPPNDPRRMPPAPEQPHLPPMPQMQQTPPSAQLSPSAQPATPPLAGATWRAPQPIIAPAPAPTGSGGLGSSAPMSAPMWNPPTPLPAQPAQRPGNAPMWPSENNLSGAQGPTGSANPLRQQPSSRQPGANGGEWDGNGGNGINNTSGSGWPRQS